MSAYRVSVAMSVYNGERYLREMEEMEVALFGGAGGMTADRGPLAADKSVAEALASCRRTFDW